VVNRRYATCGEVGFEGRSDYAAIGSVTNLASRLTDEASGGQVLIAQRRHAEIESASRLKRRASSR
jgi:adenylate cyclase